MFCKPLAFPAFSVQSAAEITAMVVLWKILGWYSFAVSAFQEEITMRLSNRSFAAMAAFTLTLITAGAARANTITGNLWHVPEAVTLNAIPANVPAAAPDVVFDVNSPFNFSGTNVSVGAWLASSGAFNIVENTAGTLTSQMDNSVVGTLLNFTGFVTVTNGQMFTVTHDDGLTLIIGGLNLGFSPLPTPPITSVATYTGPSGNFAFQLVYAECCQGPAVLQVELPFSNTEVPEPATMLLVGTGLVSVALGRIRNRTVPRPKR
jgi:PEP-CTERM motif